MEKLLVTTNNFWLGGRETYLDTWLEALRERGVSADLLASQIQPGVPGLERFDRIGEAGSLPPVERFQAWLAAGETMMADPTALIWSHHFDLLPAWLLSRLHSIPLLVTFHGPLVDAGRPNDPLQALGMTLAIHRAEGISGVSEEIVEQLGDLRGGAGPDPVVIPNTVRVGSEGSAPLQLPPKRLVMVTRRDKLEHIRAGVLLFAEYARHVRGARLFVADGEKKGEPERFGQPLGTRLQTTLRQLGRRWCLAQGPRLLRALPAIEFIGWTADARALIRRCDAVLGMGRVILEALAERRPAVLIGYQAVHGLVTAESFARFRWSNFSGRKMAAADRRRVAKQLAALSGDAGVEVVLDPISSDVGVHDLLAVLESVGAGNPPADDLMLAQTLTDAIRGGRSAEDLLAVAAGRMSE
ncbi:MAG TPA: glycosyltransferase, partial [Thermoanaerobaculia bacterium]|nr:glycosyltransferase [Thermoanaerobaculia bacterium]